MKCAMCAGPMKVYDMGHDLCSECRKAHAATPGSTVSLNRGTWETENGTVIRIEQKNAEGNWIGKFLVTGGWGVWFSDGRPVVYGVDLDTHPHRLVRRQPIIFSNGSTPGLKNDQGKLRFDLVPPEAEEAIVKVLTDGAREYGDNNWKNVTPFFQRYVAAILRHTSLRRKGEVFDEKSGSPHWAHVAANAMFLLWKDLQEQGEKQCGATNAGGKSESTRGTTLSTETSIACPAGSNTGSGSSDAK